MNYQVSALTFEQDLSTVVTNKQAHLSNHTFHRRRGDKRHSHSFSTVPFQQFDLVDKLPLLFGCYVKLFDCRARGQQHHLAIKINRPDKTDVEQNIQRFFPNEVAKHTCANHVSNHVILMFARFRCYPIDHASPDPPDELLSYATRLRALIRARVAAS